MARLAVLDAQAKNFATSFVVVSDNDLKFHKFDDVYRKVVSELGTARCPRGALSDILDRCADTKPGAKVDASGCDLPAAPMTKSGGAGAAGAAGAAAAAAGAMEVPTTAGASMVLTGVNFESGSTKLKPGSLNVLDGIAAQLKSSGAKVEVGGHSDASGSAAINRALSQRRAESVVAYLAAKGVPSANMTAKGYGPDKPVAPNTSAEGKAKNRRVELQVIESR
jgi:OOP family OmpA-OmpF porin